MGPVVAVNGKAQATVGVGPAIAVYAPMGGGLAGMYSRTECSKGDPP